MIDSLAAEFTNTSPVSIEVLILRILGAVIFCGAIGLEREFRNSAAGIRTNMLIGLAAPVFTLVTLQLMTTLGQNLDTTRFDPIRLAEEVTAGNAFLPACVIIYPRGDVHRSEEPRVGTECARQCRYMWWQQHEKQKQDHSVITQT